MMRVGLAKRLLAFLILVQLLLLVSLSATVNGGLVVGFSQLTIFGHTFAEPPTRFFM